MEGYDGKIGDACGVSFRIVFDLVFLFVEFAFTEEVVDGFVVLFIV